LLSSLASNKNTDTSGSTACQTPNGPSKVEEKSFNQTNNSTNHNGDLVEANDSDDSLDDDEVADENSTNRKTIISPQIITSHINHTNTDATNFTTTKLPPRSVGKEAGATTASFDKRLRLRDSEIKEKKARRLSFHFSAALNVSTGKEEENERFLTLSSPPSETPKKRFFFKTKEKDSIEDVASKEKEESDTKKAHYFFHRRKTISGVVHHPPSQLTESQCNASQDTKTLPQIPTSENGGDVLGSKNSSLLVTSEDRKFMKRFSLPERELLIREFTCTMRRHRITSTGILYISQNTVCYHSSFFAYKIQEVLYFDQIASITRVDPRSTLITTLNQKNYLFKFISNPGEAHGILQSIFTSTNEKKKTPKKRTNEEGKLEMNLDDILATSQLMLQPEDWDLILKGLKVISFKKDHFIIHQHQQYQRIYQIVKGSCRVETIPTTTTNSDSNTDQPAAPLVVGRIGEKEIFGEISFLRKTGATASVVADTDVDVYVIEGYFLNILFDKADRALCGRFYNYLCSVLAIRLGIDDDDNPLTKMPFS